MNIIKIRQTIDSFNHTLCEISNYVISECSCLNCKIVKAMVRKELKKAVAA